MDPCRLRRLHHLVHRGVLPSVGDILKDRSLEYPGVLQHHRVGAPQALPGKRADFIPVHIDRAPVHVIEAHQQVDNRGLSRARGADDGDELSGVRRKGDVIQNHLGGVVAEEDVVQPDITLYLRKSYGIFDVAYLLSLVQKAEHSLRRCQRGVDLVHDVGDLIDRSREFPGVKNEGGDLPYRDRAV